MRPQDTTPTGVVRIPLRARDGAVRNYAIVDAADAAWVNQWRWHLSTKGYVSRTAKISGQYVKFRLHRELLGLTNGDGFEGDHINRDRLDNRRCNLRAVSHAANTQNVTSHQGTTSKHRGVSWNKQKRKWEGRVRVNGRAIHLGYFADESQAAEAARAARARLLPNATD